MKQITVILMLLVIVAAGCKKDKTEPNNAASINVVNVAVGVPNIKVNAGYNGGITWSAQINLAYGASTYYTGITGSRTVTVVSATDTTKALYSQNVNVPPISTLYIAGQFPNIDTIFREEKNIPYNQTVAPTRDSALYIRYVNLSPNSGTVNIKIRNATTNEATALAYKGITDFKKYVAGQTTANYILEVRDATTDALRYTYTLATATNRFKTLSIVFRGIIGGTGTAAPNVTLVIYY